MIMAAVARRRYQCRNDSPADVVRIEVPRARHKRREATKATCGLLVAQEN